MHGSVADTPAVGAIPPNSDRARDAPCLARRAMQMSTKDYRSRLMYPAVHIVSRSWHPRPTERFEQLIASHAHASVLAQRNAMPRLELRPSPSLAYVIVSQSTIIHNAQQLPSPISPTTRPHLPPANGRDMFSQEPRNSPPRDHLPIGQFIAQLLRRSRTSTGVLQTALCYLQALLGILPRLFHQGKLHLTAAHGASSYAEPRIIHGLPTRDTPHSAATSATAADCIDNTSSVLPPLPSPLCCPHRTFLACLILASKFTQDHSYSNRAWAKLAGLPPREVGCCERAVGEALDWRLWVVHEIRLAAEGGAH
ncbi:hypothetical protein NUW54_g3828 [Trametes sanguinea]|uniref:Uncharacterized protein n=1 Tax=Trametes sanguinea TaxID=158606 RepID=A0ACC1Q0S1_9APHY|nr:hypothetical protein NUW54_g3828 [Trametes sanguinea]